MLASNVVPTGLFQFVMPAVAARSDYYIRYRNSVDLGTSELFCVKPTSGAECSRLPALTAPAANKPDGWVSSLETLRIVMFK